MRIARFELPGWKAAMFGLLTLGLFYFAWIWVVERHEVSPGEFLVKIHLTGKALPEETILAPDASYQGIQPEVLSEGRYFINPFLWATEEHKAVVVPAGKGLILTRKFGRPIPADRVATGDVLARDGERGILEEVRKPGVYRVNPYAYEYQLVDAIEVKAEQVGVRVLKIGKDALTVDKAQHYYVQPDGYRGVQAAPTSPGTYYINPHVERIVPIELRSHRVEFSDISFPSRDGFRLRPHVLVTYRVSGEKAPELFVTLSDQDTLFQADASAADQAKNPILQKVILPLVRGYVRIEGSKYAAGEFVNQAVTVEGAPKEIVEARNARERLQEALLKKVKAPCEEIGIVLESVTLTQFEEDKELSEMTTIIAERELARLKRERNKEKIDQYTKEAETKAAEALVEQKSKLVEATTKMQVEMTKAKQRLEVEESKLTQELTNMKTRLEAAKDQAKATVALGKNEAEVIEAQNQAEVSGLKTRVGSFPSADHFARQQLIAKLAPALKEIFASDSGDFGRIFSDYFKPSGSTPAGGGRPAYTTDQPEIAGGR